MMENKNTGDILKGMTDQSDEICFIFDVNKNCFQYVNAAFEAITKRETSELFKKPQLLFNIIHKDDLIYIQKAFDDLLTLKTNSLLNFRICLPDNTNRWIRLKVYPIVKDDNILFLTGLGEDDTVRKTSIFNMEKINGWKDANLEILSHDLRGPIGTVQMLASVIDKKLPNDPQLQKLTKMIAEISKRSINLIQTLLKKEFLATEEVTISRERLDVVWEINQALDIYLKSQDYINKQIKITCPHDHIYAEIDSMKFLQIINNLVSNAIKFTGDDGKINIHLEKLEATFLFTIEDNGIGIPKKIQPYLFKKYTKAGRRGLKGEESVGLGMWIVKTLTEQHGGKVWFESQPDHGSTFYVEIPFEIDQKLETI